VSAGDEGLTVHRGSPVMSAGSWLYNIIRVDATGRRDHAAELAALEFRAEIWAELTACSGHRNVRFQLHHIEALAHWLEIFECRPWTRQAVKTARRNPVFKAYFGAAWIRAYFGRGRKTRASQTLMAQGIAGLTLDAFRGADELAGRRRRRGVGSIKGPVLKFTQQRLARIATLAGEKAPNLEALRKALGRPRQHLTTSQRRTRTSKQPNKTNKNVPSAPEKGGVTPRS
jgi:hypothetical protein